MSASQPRLTFGQEDHHSFVAVGLGPANLSLAALAEPIAELNGLFFERSPDFRWHPGLMLPGAEMQVSFLKDLVTMVDPSNQFSFLNFLAKEGRLYRFSVLLHRPIPRREFEQYYQWVVRQLSGIRFGATVTNVRVENDSYFTVETTVGSAKTQCLVIGVGGKPQIPEFAAKFSSGDVFHAAELATRRWQAEGKRVVIVGGGQTAAEVVDYLLSGARGTPTSLTWISSRHGLLPLDDSPFSNDWFNPRYVESFHALPSESRRELNARQLLASDGISERLLRRLYGRLYDTDYLSGTSVGSVVEIWASHRVDHYAEDDGIKLRVRDLLKHEDVSLHCDSVLWCTGYQQELPEFLQGLDPTIVPGVYGLSVDRGYRLEWGGPPGLDIYIQNLAEASHGLADRNLSLNSWRSAVIINQIVRRKIYDTDQGDLTGAKVQGSIRQSLPTGPHI